MYLKLLCSQNSLLFFWSSLLCLLSSRLSIYLNFYWVLLFGSKYRYCLQSFLSTSTFFKVLVASFLWCNEVDLLLMSVLWSSLWFSNQLLKQNTWKDKAAFGKGLEMSPLLKFEMEGFPWQRLKCPHE